MHVDLQAKKEPMQYMYGEMAETLHLRERCPTPTDWDISRSVTDVLDFPCKLVIKNQDKGHWLLASAMCRLVDLWLHLHEQNAKPVPTLLPNTTTIGSSTTSSQAPRHGASSGSSAKTTPAGTLVESSSGGASQPADRATTHGNPATLTSSDVQPAIGVAAGNASQHSGDPDRSASQPTSGATIGSTSARTSAMCSAQGGFAAKLHRLQREMREHIIEKTVPLILPLTQYSSSRAHQAMAVILDPRFFNGKLFVRAADMSLPMKQRRSQAKTLRSKYIEKHIIPMAMSIARFLHDEKTRLQNAGQNNENQTTNAAEADDNVDDENLLSGSDVDSDLGLLDAQDLEQENKESAWHAAVKCELAAMQQLCADVNSDASPLDWWRMHGRKLPMLREVARIVLGVPASQIECERVFSEAGLITSGLRNRLGVENLDTLVFISRNVDAKRVIYDAISAVHGSTFADRYMQYDMKMSSDVDIIQDELADVDVSNTDLFTSAVEHMIANMRLGDDDDVDDDALSWE